MLLPDEIESDKSNSLEVMISQTQGFGKAIRPLFADPVTFSVAKTTLRNNTSPPYIERCIQNIFRWLNIEF